VRQILLVSLLVVAFLPARAWRGRRYFGSVAVGSPQWRSGYWFHGRYIDHWGWWWIVGPNWYYYSEPMYPYPSIDVPPTYFAVVPSAPPPAVPETSAPQSPPVGSSTAKSQAFTYYCEKTKSYYPLSPTCEAGWVVTKVRPPQ